MGREDVTEELEVTPEVVYAATMGDFQLTLNMLVLVRKHGRLAGVAESKRKHTLRGIAIGVVTTFSLLTLLKLIFHF